MLPPEIPQKPVKGVIYTHWHYIMGMDTVIVNAKEAFKEGEYQWSAQQTTYAIRAGSDEARQVKADALRKMAQKAAASNTRNWMLTHALVLEGKLELHRSMPDLPCCQTVISTGIFPVYHR